MKTKSATITNLGNYQDCRNDGINSKICDIDQPFTSLEMGKCFTKIKREILFNFGNINVDLKNACINMKQSKSMALISSRQSQGEGSTRMGARSTNHVISLVIQSVCF